MRENTCSLGLLGQNAQAEGLNFFSCRFGNKAYKIQALVEFVSVRPFSQACIGFLGPFPCVDTNEAMSPVRLRPHHGSLT